MELNELLVEEADPVERGPKEFKLYSKRVFLTYSQAQGITKEELQDHILGLLGRANVSWMVTAQEQHEDGEPHFHVVIETIKRKKYNDSRFFDFKDKHPKIEPVRDVKAAINYVKKDVSRIKYFNL